jgi:hypothetical protein
MQLRHHLRIIGLLSAGFLLQGSGARAGTVGKEAWIAGGVTWPAYYVSSGIACLRGGIGAVFLQHVTLGVSAQANRYHNYYFADAGLILPPLGLCTPYGRFQYGRRDDGDDAAMGWVGGFRLGEDSVQLFLEGHGVFEPERDAGVSLGISF